jgi:anaerobic selenocysteine-containing dehydrogenase
MEFDKRMIESDKGYLAAWIHGAWSQSKPCSFYHTIISQAKFRVCHVQTSSALTNTTGGMEKLTLPKRRDAQDAKRNGTHL